MRCKVAGFSYPFIYVFNGGVKKIDRVWSQSGSFYCVSTQKMAHS
jgi:hypothetical protein